MWGKDLQTGLKNRLSKGEFKNLSPYTGREGILELMVGSRKHPVLQPGDHWVSWLIIQHSPLQTCRGGSNSGQIKKEAYTVMDLLQDSRFTLEFSHESTVSKNISRLKHSAKVFYSNNKDHMYAKQGKSSTFHEDRELTCVLQRDLTQQQHLETDGVLSLHGISWINYMGFGVDNIDKFNEDKSKRNCPSCYFMGCPCHLKHNISYKASEALSDTSEFGMEDIQPNSNIQEKRENASFEDVEFYLKKYSTVLLAQASDTHLIQDEFVMYQLQAPK
ncbi:hypothetical protein P5673_023478 [Acropora cervicornis]|uniref:Uncharacterized protein n=1 Tax=Acropora cervicornis TaxID=6130 RepID=A0AAD9UYR2_ACRCE|nr:hypothetical protein P5673_023478 [Acropora cervicornis]